MNETPLSLEIVIPMPGFPMERAAYVQLPGKLSQEQWDFFVGVLMLTERGCLASNDSEAPVVPVAA